MRPRRRGFPRGFRGRGAEDHENQLIQSLSGVKGDFLGPEDPIPLAKVRLGSGYLILNRPLLDITPGSSTWDLYGGTAP